MDKIDWSKPIELYYSPRQGPPPLPAEVVATGLDGRFSVLVRWSDKLGYVKETTDDEGCILGCSWRVRNVPTQATKYILLSKRLNPGENPNSPRVVVLYSTYEEAKANCDESHKIVEVSYVM